MDKEEDEYSIIDSKANENSRLKLNNCLLDKHSSKVRRRNVIDKNNSSLSKDNDFNCNKNIEFSLDREKAWIYDIPKLPEISNIDSPGN